MSVFYARLSHIERELQKQTLALLGTELRKPVEYFVDGDDLKVAVKGVNSTAILTLPFERREHLGVESKQLKESDFRARYRNQMDDENNFIALSEIVLFKNKVVERPRIRRASKRTVSSRSSAGARVRARAKSEESKAPSL